MTRETHRHVIILIASVAFSLGGIAVAIYRGVFPDAGLGGAIAVAISLFALFANKPYGQQLYDLLTKEPRTLLGPENPTTLADPDGQALKLIKALTIRINVDIQGQEKQNRFMAWAAAIGTLAWGFGEKLAACLAPLFKG